MAWKRDRLAPRRGRGHGDLLHPAARAPADQRAGERSSPASPAPACATPSSAQEQKSETSTSRTAPSTSRTPRPRPVYGRSISARCCAMTCWPGRAWLPTLQPPTARSFRPGRGARRDKDNINARVIRPAVRRANERRAAARPAAATGEGDRAHAAADLHLDDVCRRGGDPIRHGPGRPRRLKGHPGDLRQQVLKRRDPASKSDAPSTTSSSAAAPTDPSARSQRSARWLARFRRLRANARANGWIRARRRVAATGPKRRKPRICRAFQRWS